ncbi:hypothetical protein D1007_26448 [Hordeum vulgare]|nr:hypothetical protein D1007_26448 [Hordeum vulgare]
MYHRVTLSCSPSAGSACIVLLVHMPLGELSYCNGPSLVVKRIMHIVRRQGDDPSSMYVLQAPWGDILQIWRWRSYEESPTPVELPRHLEGHNKDDINPYIELRTTEIEVYKVDLENQTLVKMANLADHALFLGYNSTMCFASKDFPTLKPNCVYITDDSVEYVNMY